MLTVFWNQIFIVGALAGVVLGFGIGRFAADSGQSSPVPAVADTLTEPAPEPDSAHKVSNQGRESAALIENPELEPDPGSAAGKRAALDMHRNRVQDDLVRIRQLTREIDLSGNSGEKFRELREILLDAPLEALDLFYLGAATAGLRDLGADEQLEWLVANQPDISTYFGDLMFGSRVVEETFFARAVDSFRGEDRLQDLSDHIYQIDDIGKRHHLIEQVIPRVLVETEDYSQLADLPTEELRDSVGRNIIRQLDKRSNREAAIDFYFSDHGGVVQDPHGEIIHDLITPAYARANRDFLLQFAREGGNSEKAARLSQILKTAN